jgi:hypothetical protein
VCDPRNLVDEKAVALAWTEEPEKILIITLKRWVMLYDVIRVIISILSI